MKFKRSIEVLKSLAVAAGLFVLTQSSLAQEAEVPKTFIYATYYNCGAGSLSRADEITANDAPIMDKLVADGKISGWGYYAHHTGGQWQRLSYHTANSMDQLLDGGDAINDAYIILQKGETIKNRDNIIVSTDLHFIALVQSFR